MRIGFLAISVVCALLAACGGGGGDSPPPVAFTSFSAIQSGQTVDASGLSQTMNATTDTSGNVVSGSLNAPDTSGSSARMVFGNGLNLTGLTFNAPGSSASWSAQNIQCDSLVCAAGDNNAAGGLMNALGAPAWNYQTFGYWLAEGSGNAASAGAMSVGNATPGNSVPTSGMATYTSYTGGIHVAPNGIVSIYGSRMTAIVDYTMGTVDFTTSVSVIAPISTGAVTPLTILDLHGMLTLVPGNQFNGAVTTRSASPALNGYVTGRFYGPAAEEIGGTFALTGRNPEGLLGTFGGKR